MDDILGPAHQRHGFLLSTIRIVAQRFIECHYTGESPYFEDCWRVLSSKIHEALDSAPTGQLAIESPEHLIKNLSLAGPASLGLVTPIVVGTITQTLCALKDHQANAEELKLIVASSAAHLGASHQLTACLIQHIPGLIVDILKNQREGGDALVGKASPPQYAIWTMGEERMVGSITTYEHKRNQYLLWLDLNETSHVLASSPKTRIGQQAVHVLIYLVRNLGVVRPAKELYREVWDPMTDEVDSSHIDAIEQQFTKLNRFTGGQFRKHLLRGEDNGYGLRESFANRYFLFKRLR
jgi:hypothetical protein